MKKRLSWAQPEALARELGQATSQLLRGAQRLHAMPESELAIATTPKDEVYAEDMVRLYHYRPLVAKAQTTPILIVYALVGRYQMIDLEPERSFVRKLLGLGHDVYMVDWGQPSRAQRWLGIDDYVCGYLDHCVDVVCSRAGVDRINLLGICQGGVFSLCYSALFAHKVQNLVLSVTPIDFHGDKADPQKGAGYMNLWTRALSSDDVDRLIDAYGWIPGAMVGLSFMLMNPAGNAAKYSTELPRILGDDKHLLNFLHMERWLSDRPNHPGEVTRQWFKDLYQDNKLVRGEFTLDGRPVLLSEVRMPVLNIFAKGDLPVPNACTRGMAAHFGSTDYSELGVPGGHIGTFVGKKAQDILAPAISHWLGARG